MGTAGRGKDHPGPDHRENDEVDFIPFSAVLAGIKEIKEIMAAAERGAETRPPEPSCSSMKSIDSTKRNRTRFCRMSSAGV
jgi:hypothetical protein